jgi:bifunctional DNA-binding transcriptional regulator/antitoxin component of YhaV-PrlF toxin-antitoxin module
MHLQKQLNRVVADKEYAKYLLVIPPETVEELEWKEGQELEHEVKDHTLLIRRAELGNEEEALRIVRKTLRTKRR